MSDMDRFAAQHPAFRRFVSGRINVFFETSLHGNIWTCLTVSIAAGLLSHSTNEPIRWIALIAMLTVWLYASVLAGFLKQWVFIFFQTMYYLLPQILIINTDSGEPMRETQYLVSDIVSAVWTYPLEVLAPNIDCFITEYILLGIYVLTFFAGVRLRAAMKHSDLYCRIRLDQLK